MARYRRARVNDEVGRVVAEAIRSVKDPRVAGELITVTQCEVSGDLKYAKVYFSVLGAESEKIKEIKKGFTARRALSVIPLRKRLICALLPNLLLNTTTL